MNGESESRGCDPPAQDYKYTNTAGTGEGPEGRGT